MGLTVLFPYRGCADVKTALSHHWAQNQIMYFVTHASYSVDDIRSKAVVMRLRVISQSKGNVYRDEKIEIQRFKKTSHLKAGRKQ